MQTPRKRCTRRSPGFSVARETGDHWTDSLPSSHPRRDFIEARSGKQRAAEEAFLTAIAVAQQQKARSFELRAALSLAKLYQSTGRAGDAHAVLAPALEGFSPTPEFPEIEEAQTLLAALAETDEVRTATAARRQRVELQVAYANALISARGHGAKETTAAFARARDLAADIDDPAERFPIYYGIWVGSLVRGELSVMRDIAEAAGRDAESNPGLSEVCTGWRIVGVTRSYEGDFVAARAALEKTLATFNPQRDRDLAFRFVQDIGVSATIQLAQTLWAQGEIRRANDLAIGSVEQADRTGHVATMVYVHCVHAFLLVVRRDPLRAAIEVGAFAALARKMRCRSGWPTRTSRPWVRWHDGHRDADLGAMRAGIAQAHAQKITLYVPLLETALAGAEARSTKSTPRSRASITRSWRLGAPGSAGSKPRRTVSTATFYSGAIRQTRRRRKKPSSPPSPLRNNKRRGVSSYSRRFRWRSFINRPIARPTPTLCSHPRWKALRRRRNFRKSKRPRLFLPLWPIPMR